MNTTSGSVSGILSATVRLSKYMHRSFLPAITRTLICFSTLLYGLDAAAISALVETRPQCGSTLGSCMVHVVGGRPPYVFSWSNGATTGTITNLVPGTYTVTVTDADGGVATASGVVAVQGPDQLLDWGLAGDAFCPDGHIQTPVARWSPQTTSVGPPPYFFNDNEVYPDGEDPFQSMYLIHIPTNPGSSVQMRFQDGNGCGGVIQASAGFPVVWPSVDIQAVWGACQGGANGGIRAVCGSEQNGYPVAAEIRNAQGVVVIPGGDYWHGWGSVTHTFQGLAAGNYTLHQRLTMFTSSSYYSGCSHVTPFTIPDLGSTCGTVSGTVYMDTDEDCVMDAASSEPRVPRAILRFLPGPYYATANDAGAYSLALPHGTYTVDQESSSVGPHCSTTVTVTGTHVLNIADTSLVGMDAEVRINQGPARPGFVFQQSAVVWNRSPHPTGATTTTFTHDPALTLLEASPPPTGVSGNTLTWSQGGLAAFQSRSVTLRLQVPVGVGLGTRLHATATVATANTDVAPTNNTHQLAATVTGSYDPNDKLASTSLGNGAVTGYDPAVDEFVDYTIRFQNTGTDTAFTVLITDTLPTGLEPTSIRMGAASHPFTWELRGRGVLTFKFENILLPDSNVNEPRSHGFVGFRIRPKAGVLEAPGHRVDNMANIYFDFNPPVITEPCVVQVPQPDVLLWAKVLLEGVEGVDAGLMNDALRSRGHLPLLEPYTALGYTHTGGGGERVSPSVFSAAGTDAIVDWVVVELRATSMPHAVVRSASALLQRDGDIVDLDGTSPLGMAVPPGNYLIAVRHRNHLGVMTANAVSLQQQAPAVVDFTIGTTTTHGTNARSVVNGHHCLWCGDGDGNGRVKYTGVGNDRDPILQGVGGTVPTNVVGGVYSTLDINLDGQLKYTGRDNDRDPILRTIGGSVPTATRDQQLP